MQCFFDCFRDVSYETIGFETTFGQTAFKSGLETYDSVADVPQKVKKTSCDSSGSPGRLWRSGLALGASGKVWWSSGRDLGGSNIYKKRQNIAKQYPYGSIWADTWSN